MRETETERERERKRERERVDMRATLDGFLMPRELM